jgi:hypothetical protein
LRNPNHPLTSPQNSSSLPKGIKRRQATERGREREKKKLKINK